MSLAALDSNILVYAFTRDDPRTVPARDLLRAGHLVSVQALNEFTNVVRRKLGFTWAEGRKAVEDIQTFTPLVLPLTIDVHHRGVVVAERHRLSFYDALIVAAALEAGCDTLYSEDMHDGLVIDGRLTVINPFA